MLQYNPELPLWGSLIESYPRVVAEIAILDLETTSRNPYKARIVEIGITIWDPDVNSQPQEWESLINPLVHIPEETIRIHKISAQDIQLAPTFTEVAEEAARLVDRRVVVGHNLPSYDKVVLNRAFQSAQIPFEIERVFDTRSIDSRKLEVIAAELGMDVSKMHSAIQDTRVCLEILQKHQVNPNDLAQGMLHRAPKFEHKTVRTVSRYQAGMAGAEYELRPISRIDELAHVEPETVYLHLLDEVLENMALSDEDWERLDDFAEQHKIVSSKREELHLEYLSQLQAAALRDHVVSEREYSILQKVSDLLEVPLSVQITAETGEVTLTEESIIVSTGSVTIDGRKWDKIELERHIRSHNFQWAGNVTKKTTLVICQEVYATTGNATRAKKYGIPRWTIEEFLSTFPPRV